MKIWKIEILKEDPEDCNEMLYDGIDEKEAFDALMSRLHTKTLSYSAIGEALIVGYFEYAYSRLTNDKICVSCTEQLD